MGGSEKLTAQSEQLLEALLETLGSADVPARTQEEERVERTVLDGFYARSGQTRQAGRVGPSPRPQSSRSAVIASVVFSRSHSTVTEPFWAPEQQQLMVTFVRGDGPGIVVHGLDPDENKLVFKAEIHPDQRDALLEAIRRGIDGEPVRTIHAGPENEDTIRDPSSHDAASRDEIVVVRLAGRENEQGLGYRIVLSAAPAAERELDLGEVG